MAPGIRGHAVGYSRSTRAISSSALGRSVPLSGSDVDAASYVSSFDVVVPMALSRSSLSLSALYCVEKLRAKPAGDGARADDAGFGGPPRATDTASPVLYDDAGWVNSTERPSMRGRHCAGLTGCNTKNQSSTQNQSGKSAKWKRLSRTRQNQKFSRDMREKGRYDDNGAHFRRRHGGAEVGDGRISAARVSAGSRGEARFTFPYLFVTTGLTRRWERRCSTVVLHTRYEGSVYLPRLPGSTPDLRGDPPRDFRSRS